MALNLDKVFNKFAGKEVQTTETVHHTKRGDRTSVEIASSDTVVAQLRQAVEDMGLKLRLWLPGTFGTMDYRTDRVNARVEKGTDGKYRIGSGFNIG